MPRGLRIPYNDGGPAMEITAGLRCPSFCQNVSDAGSGNQFTINQRVDGSQIVLIPRNTVDRFWVGTNLIPTIVMLDGFTVNGNTMTMNNWRSDGLGSSRTFASSIWQILPTSSGRGLLIKDSTDFLSITDATMSGYCVWRGTVTFTGSWATPTTNISRDRYMVFAKWSADNVTIEFDGSNIIATIDHAGLDQDATVTMQIAIFASGVSPTPGRGLNIIKGGVCVFSTTRRPFVYRNQTYTPSWSNTNIGEGMILLGRYGYNSEVYTGWDYLKWAGLIRSGNLVRAGRGRNAASWTSKYSVVGRRLTSLSIPVIDAIY
ncbi:DUF6453 family protein [Enterobacter pseudoroggenkampii]|uniref:DUF6453 family protein n=1 Tax=Enterobacter TaxID=547 RepID=UPI00223DFE1D|nr:MULTISPECIES: DUF6453 family protein [Enterobacter]